MLYLIIIASCCTSLGVKKKQIIVGQWNCWNWCLELLWRSVCLTEPLFKCCISFLHVAPDAKNCLSFCNELLTRFWEPFNTCFSNFTEVCTNPNIHFPPCTNQCCWPVLVFYREPELLRFCHFQYLSRTIWFDLGLFNIFKTQNPSISGQAWIFLINSSRFNGFLILITTCISGLVGAQFQLLNRNNCGTDFKVKMWIFSWKCSMIHSDMLLH